MAALTGLHLTPALAAALEALGWSGTDPEVKEAVPTAARGHDLALIVPAAPGYLAPVLGGIFSRLPPGQITLLLCPAVLLDELGRLSTMLTRETGHRVHLAHRTARASRQLGVKAVDILVTTPDIALSLHRQSKLPLETVAAVFLAWPESWDDEEGLSALMQDLGKETQRVVASSAPAKIVDLAERYVRRALTIGGPAMGQDPVGPVRVVAVPWVRRVTALTGLLELLDPASAVVWTLDRSQHQAIAQAIPLAESNVRVVVGDAPSAEVVVAFDPPSPTRLRQLLRAGEVVLLSPPGTEAYLARIAAPRRPLPLPGALDAVTTRAAARRSAIVRAIESGPIDLGLATLAPLFERFEAPTVAAALFELWTGAAAGPGATLPPDIPATAKVYVGIGKKDGATVNDLVAVLTKEVRLDRGKIGRVELRESYMLVELPAQEAERVVSALNGTTIRRRRVTARVDRGTPGRPPARAPRPRR